MDRCVRLMKDPRVDAYIRGAPEFARPILEEIRRRVHASVPGVEETIRWSAPTFQYGGQLLCGMSAFKAHCGFGFWHPLMREHDKSLEGRGQFGKIESLGDLPSAAAFRKLAAKARKLVDEGVKGPPRAKAPKDRTVKVPLDLKAALAKNAKARATFESFTFSARRDYVEWIEQAKREATREQRLSTTVKQLAEGKKLHWKYERRTLSPA
jgi:hypothetical protein